jgi:hypothetical protein
VILDNHDEDTASDELKVVEILGSVLKTKTRKTAEDEIIAVADYMMINYPSIAESLYGIR